MEYKFRGFDAVGSKGWVYGDLVHNIKITKEKDVPRVMVGGYEVAPDSVGLCTGERDRKGHIIYEGDIVRYRRAHQSDGILYKGYVYFICGAFVVGGEKNTPTLELFNAHITSIIGNAYERNRDTKVRTEDRA